MGCGCNKQCTINSRIKVTRNTSLSITPGAFSRLVPSKTFEFYKQLFSLGNGAFSDVYLCDHIPSSQKRALKIIAKSNLVAEQLDKDLKLQELSILKKLDHPNILKCYEVFEDQTNYYLSTEYCKGGDLFKRFEKTGKLPENIVSNIMFQVLSALAHCHDMRIIHRDIKLENVFLNDEIGFGCKIGDFGSSCVLKKNAKAKDVFGSPYYLAPEVLDDCYDKEVDLWSCGVMMYILLTNKPPYIGKTPQAIKCAIRLAPLRITFKNFIGFSKNSREFITELLEVDPTKRISAYRALHHPFIEEYRINQTTPLLDLLKNPIIYESTLKKAVCLYITTYLLDSPCLQTCKEVFQTLDANCDGRLDINEITQEFVKENHTEEEAESLSRYLIEKIDLNGTRSISYSEFVLAFLDSHVYLSENFISTAFKVFEEDHDGLLSLGDIEKVVGTVHSNKADFSYCEELFGKKYYISEETFIKAIKEKVES